MAVDIEPSWLNVLQDEFEKPYMATLRNFLKSEAAAGHKTYPKNGDIFNAFNTTPFDKVKVVILGQDPYHGPDQAHGLCFSVRPGIPVPPSLVNIFTEYSADLGYPKPANGDLTPWSERGVLLLNRVLTVEPGQPGSHRGKGWEQVTEQAIRALAARAASADGTPMVAILWGRDARTLVPLLDGVPCVESAHPSPNSAHNGFFGTRPFSRANHLLEQQGAEPVDWKLP